MSNPGRLAGKHALVAGGSRGIGEAIARRFVAEGARIIVTARNREPGRALVEELGSAAMLRVFDASDEEAWPSLVEEFEDDPIDVLVNNAGGLLIPKELHLIEPDEWRDEIKQNLTGPFLAMRFMIPMMLRHGGGSIINMGSMSGVIGQYDAGAYQAAKGGVRMLTRNAAVTYATRGIRVNSINPGPIATDGSSVREDDKVRFFLGRTPMHRWGTPMEVAHLAVMLASDESTYVTGAEFNVDGGYLA